jgi:aryl-alcohol dehydrogenase-like predicted oxidoreductase
MEKRRLGRSGLEVAPLIFGGNVFGWTLDREGSFRLLDAFVDAGFNCIDTADVYSRWHPGNSGGESEIIIGNWLKARGNRDKVIIATKCGLELAPDKKGLSKTYIMQAIEASLQRLQTDYVDLYQSHRDDPETPVEETMEAHARLVEQGKVRIVGASNFTAPRLNASLSASRTTRWPRYETLQPNYSLCERSEFEGDLQDLCVSEEIAVIPYYSLASGFLTGKYRTKEDLGSRPRAAGAGKYLNERGLRILGTLDQVADRYQATPAQIALAWLAAQPAVAAPIASATSTEQLTELLGFAKVKLDAEAVKLLNEASA